MLFVTAGFAVFFVHALITVPELFSDTYQIAMSENIHLLIHLIASIDAGVAYWENSLGQFILAVSKSDD